MKRTLLSAALAAALFLGTGAATAAGYAYHGNLQDAGKPANGSYDIELTLYSAQLGGNVIGGPLTLYAVPVRDGNFNAEADFGPLAKAFSQAYVGVKVRAAGSSDFAALDARAAVTPDTNASCPGSWSLDGNAGNPGGSFVGNVDNQPLYLDANNTAIGKLDAPVHGAPNVVFGAAAVNAVAIGTYGATISGGGDSTCSPPGCANAVAGNYATVSGGSTNQANGIYAVVGGGLGNKANGSRSSLVSGGEGNTASSDYATVSGGGGNVASSLGAIVGGGTGNSATGQQATIGGGDDNIASGASATVAGGGAYLNDTCGPSGDLPCGNTASGDYSFIGGGTGNIAQGVYATITGGGDNIANGVGATVSGGRSNTAGGTGATVSGGDSNVAGGIGSMVAGGVLNVASGNYSFASGTNASSSHQGTFVWADNSTGLPFSSSGQNQFLVRSAGGIGLNNNTIPSGAILVAGTNGTNGNGAKLTTGGAWTNGSSREFKEAFAAIDAGAILTKVLDLPITTWRYKQSSEGTHLGPVAEDFKSAFGLGGDQQHIATVDEEGVALAAIQGLNRKVETENARLKQQNAQLQSKLDEVFARLSKLEAGKGQ
jgi:trimeric autotransporter adhesin